jgi:hypothetical protein
MTRYIALLILAISWISCASQPRSRDQRPTRDIQYDDFNTGWDNRQQCLEDYNFSPSVLSACLTQQPRGANDKLWATRCFHLADLGDDWHDVLLGEDQHASFTRRVIGVADCYQLRKFFEPRFLLSQPTKLTPRASLR